MRHPAVRLVSTSLLLPQKLAQQRLLGALLASVMLHGVLLSQLTHGTRSHTVAEPEPPVLITHLWIPAPSLKPPPSVVPIVPTERTTAETQDARHTVRQPKDGLADAPSAAVMPADTQNPESVEPPPSSAQSSPRSDRLLDLSPQVISQVVRRNSSPSLAQTAREQLGHEIAPAAARLGQHMASGAAFTMHPMARPNPVLWPLAGCWPCLLWSTPP